MAAALWMFPPPLPPPAPPVDLGVVGGGASLGAEERGEAVEHRGRPPVGAQPRCRLVSLACEKRDEHAGLARRRRVVVHLAPQLVGGKAFAGEAVFAPER